MPLNEEGLTHEIRNFTTEKPDGQILIKHLKLKKDKKQRSEFMKLSER